MKLTIWNKVVQTLLISENEPSILLGLILLPDTLSVCHWRYLEKWMCEDINLPCIYFVDEVLSHVVCDYAEELYQNTIYKSTSDNIHYLTKAYENYLNSLE